MIEGGRVNRISAAVLVDGIYAKNDKGEIVYQPRTKEEIDRIAALVRTAIGFDHKRGDQVEVVNLRFAETPPIPISEPAGWMSFLQFTKDDIMRGVELGVMALLGLLVLLYGGAAAGPPHRDARRRRGRSGAACAPPSAGVAGAAAVGRPASRSPAGMTASTSRRRRRQHHHHRRRPTSRSSAATKQVAISNRTSAMIDIAQVQGQVHAQSVQKVGELAEKNPHETVAIIRTWLHEDAA